MFICLCVIPNESIEIASAEVNEMEAFKNVRTAALAKDTWSRLQKQLVIPSYQKHIDYYRFLLFSGFSSQTGLTMWDSVWNYSILQL